jgi:multimeric flavodoxin WrbA
MLKATFFIGSLKPNVKESNTAKLCKLAAKELELYGVQSKFRYLRNRRIAPGVDFETGDDWDEMKIYYQDVGESDIIVLATPIWWGIHSSLCQAWMERIGAYDDQYIKEGKSPLYNKVFGTVITASNDGFQHIQGLFYAFASNMGMTVPPEAHITWGTALTHSKSDSDPSQNLETMNMVKNACRNWYLWGSTIKKLDLGNIAQKIKPGRVGLDSSDNLKSS